MQIYEYNKTKGKKQKDDKVFDTEIYNSILNQTASMYKENSILLNKKKNDQNSFDSIQNSLEKLINKITNAEEGIPIEPKKKYYMFKSGSSTVNSQDDIAQERRTIEVSSINKAIKIGGIKSLHFKN